MVQAIRVREVGKADVKRVTLSDTEFRSLKDVDISHFITKKSINVFKRCELPYDFLDESPETWENHERELQRMFRSLQKPESRE